MQTHTPPPPPAGRLVLEDGSVFTGQPFGATGRGVVSPAEVVFCTAMTGYQEAITDPSYTGQILTLTTPLIGNVGVNARDAESSKVSISGLIITELARRTSNPRCRGTLEDALAEHGVLGLAGVDTRSLTRRLRSAGVMRGVLTDREDLTARELVDLACSAPSMAGQDLTCPAALSESGGGAWDDGLGEWRPMNVPPAAGERPKVLALDGGVKRNILRQLTERGAALGVAPIDVGAEELRRRASAGEFDGLFVSNGPGDPAAAERAVATLRDFLDSPEGRGVPVFGICLGCQLLALALGATTYKLKFGHRGANQPVVNTLTGDVEITSQNHGFAVDEPSLDAAGLRLTHRHLNDGTVAGFCSTDRPVFAVQYHPEASPGPHDSGYLFDAFLRLLGGGVSAMDALQAAVGASRTPSHLQ